MRFEPPPRCRTQCRTAPTGLECHPRGGRPHAALGRNPTRAARLWARQSAVLRVVRRVSCRPQHPELARARPESMPCGASTAAPSPVSCLIAASGAQFRGSLDGRQLHPCDQIRVAGQEFPRDLGSVPHPSSAWAQARDMIEGAAQQRVGIDNRARARWCSSRCSRQRRPGRAVFGGELLCRQDKWRT